LHAFFIAPLEYGDDTSLALKKCDTAAPLAGTALLDGAALLDGTALLTG
jgi:hypothetical protein